MTVPRRRAGAQLAPQRDFRHVADRDRNAVSGRDDDARKILRGPHLSRHAHQPLFTVAFHVAGAAIGVVAFDRRRHLVEGQTIGEQPRRIRQYVILTRIATDAVDLGDAGHLQQLRPNHPVLQGAQRHRIVRPAIRLARVGIRLHGVQEDLAQTGGDRPHRRFHAGRQTATYLLQALVDQVARKVDVRPVFEHHRELRQSVARKRARVGQLRQAAHREFDRVGDALLHLQRRIARCRYVDLHLHVGDVRHGIDRQPLIVPDAQRHQRQHQRHDQTTVADCKLQQGLKHDRVSGSVGIQCACSASPLPSSALSTKLPRVTMRSPALRPSTIST